jgi:type I restriction enzyme S subunit
MTLTAWPRYDSYKDSGVEWIGDVPATWRVEPGRQCIHENKDKNTGMRESTVLSLSYGKVIVKSEDKLTGLVPESFETYQIVQPGDIIIRGTDLQNDMTSLRTGLAKDKGIITAAYINLRPKAGIVPAFLHYLLHSYDVKKVFYALGSGLRQNLSYEDFKHLRLPIPPSEEQRAIAIFLDEKCAKVDEAVRIKEEQIALLRERRQILIQQAVTRGLNPSVSMKDSGLGWLGQMPAHWERRKIRHLFSIGRGRVIPKEELVEDGAYPVYSSQTKNDGIFGYLSTYDFDQDQLTWTTDGANAGTVFLRRGKHNCTNVCGTLTPKTNATNLDFCVNAVGYAASFHKRPDTNGAKIMNEEMAAIEFPLPPMEEQLLIFEKLSESNVKFESAYSIKERQISALKEYKTSLINAAVTGKIRVDGSAEALSP